VPNGPRGTGQPGTIASEQPDRGLDNRGNADPGNHNRLAAPGPENWATVDQRILRGLIEIVRRYPVDGDPRHQPVIELFRTVPADQARRLYSRLEPGAATDDFAQYLKQQFPQTRPEALRVLRDQFLGPGLAGSAGTRAGSATAWAEIRDDPRYIDNAFRIIGLPILGGPFYFSPDSTFLASSSRNVVVPRSMIQFAQDPLAGATVIFGGKVHPNRQLALSEATQLERETRMRVVAYYAGPHGYIFPTIVSATTAPRITEASAQAINAEHDYAAAAGPFSWQVLWWYIGLRFPLGTKPPTGAGKSLLELAIGSTEYAKQMEAVLAIRASQPALRLLSLDELIAIRAYTGEWSQAMNQALRGTSKMTPNLEVIVSRAVSGLRKLPSYTGVLRRTFPLQIAHASQMFRGGAIIVEAAFTSATKGAGVAQKEGNIVATISAVGKYGKDVSAIAEVAEQEVLFLPGARFIIEKAVRVQDALVMTWREL